MLTTWKPHSACHCISGRVKVKLGFKCNSVTQRCLTNDPKQCIWEHPRSVWNGWARGWADCFITDLACFQEFKEALRVTQLARGSENIALVVCFCLSCFSCLFLFFFCQLSGRLYFFHGFRFFFFFSKKNNPHSRFSANSPRCLRSNTTPTRESKLSCGISQFFCVFLSFLLKMLCSSSFSALLSLSLSSSLFNGLGSFII